ncbi:MAG: glycosyltransferase [Cyanobacteria bacterium J06623_7]
MTNVTIVVTPRERYSCTRQSLESIYQHTQFPFKLIYVDGNSPPKVRRYLQDQARVLNLTHLRTDYYLSPNHARNLGLQQVTTKYVVFIDNDVIVSPGWLSQLVNCAETTEATVVGPLMCQDEPVHEIVHFAGGESHIFQDVRGRRRLREKMYFQGKKVAEIRHRLQRQETELAEFHCVLIRSKIFEQLGFLDEGMLNTKEHLDFCMQVRQNGGTVYFEPEAVVTYVPGPPLEYSDLTYYMLRWSDAWVLNSLQRLRQKWNLAEDSYFTTKYKGLGWRRRDSIITPLAIAISTLTLGKMRYRWERWLTWLDRRWNRYLTDRHPGVKN